MMDDHKHTIPRLPDENFSLQPSLFLLRSPLYTLFHRPTCPLLLPFRPSPSKAPHHRPTPCLPPPPKHPTPFPCHPLATSLHRHIHLRYHRLLQKYPQTTRNDPHCSSSSFNSFFSYSFCFLLPPFCLLFFSLHSHSPSFSRPWRVCVHLCMRAHVCAWSLGVNGVFYLAGRKRVRVSEMWGRGDMILLMIRVTMTMEGVFTRSIL